MSREIDQVVAAATRIAGHLGHREVQAHDLAAAAAIWVDTRAVGANLSAALEGMDVLPLTPEARALADAAEPGAILEAWAMATRERR